MENIDIINIKDFSSVEEMLHNKLLNHNSCLYLVETAEQETAVLKKIRLIDDVCLICNKDIQLEIRSNRLRNSLRLGHHNYLDGLTGAKSRILLSQDMDRIAEFLSPVESVSLILADIDYFKRINDEYGHSTGDKVLKKFAAIMQQSAKGASVYRFGGEEFIILYKGALQQGMAMAEYIRQELEATEFSVQGKVLKITASFGVAEQTGTSDVAETIKKADQSLYEAKHRGRNRVCSYESFLKRAEEQATLPEIIDFENRMKITTDRLVEYLSIRNRQAMQHIKHLADIDGLTGLYVRRYFDERMTREYENAKKHGKSLCLIFMDLDFFGKINKIHGFPTGDKTLFATAVVMRNSVRSVDWLARYGGEEFCVILPDTILAEALEVAKRIHQGLHDLELTNSENKPFSITGSLGVGQLDVKSEKLPNFIQRVSDYTREAKKRGRDQIFINQALP